MHVNGLETVAIVLAQPGLPDNPGGQGPGFGKSTPLGLFLLLALFVGVGFLVKSMTTRLKRVPTKFDQDKAAAAAPPRVKRAEARAAQHRDAAAASDDAESAGDEGQDGPDRTGDDADENGRPAG